MDYLLPTLTHHPRRIQMTGKSTIRILGAITLFALFTTAGPGPNQAKLISRLEFLDGYTVSNNFKYGGTQVGGLSGIDYDAASDSYFLLSDDRSSLQPARYYKAKISIFNNSIDTVIFIEKTDLKTEDGKPYPSIKEDPQRTVDPEGIRYNPKNQELVWLSEGERIIRSPDTLFVNPAIFVTDQGKHTGQYAINNGLHMQSREFGPRQNGTFEGLTFAGNFSSLLVSLEEPLYQDGPRADVEESKSLIRIYAYDVMTRKNTAQYAYDLDPVAYAPILTTAFRVNGVTDILDAGNNQLLVVERSFSTGRLPCTVKVFLADLNSGTNAISIPALAGESTVIPLSKKLILNMDSLGKYIDNIEGVTWGPLLPNGHRTLVFVSDNNFQSFQKTQFLLFEVIP